MKGIRAAFVAAIALSLGACESQGISNETVGQVLGAGVGAVVGSQFGSGTGRIIATAVGTLAGAWIGGELAKRLDNRDRAMMSNSTNQALANAPNGQTVSWSNPESGNAGSTTPISSYKAPSGKNCRQFNQTVVAGGQQEARQGTACQQPDGSWQIASN